MDVLIVTGDRDALQLVSDRVTVLYNSRGRVGHAPLHPGRGRGEVRPHPGAVPRLRGAARRPQRQPARHPRGGGEDRHEVDPAVRLAHRAGRPGRRGAGQGRRQAARERRVGGAEPPAHRAAPRRDACRSGRDDLARPAVGPRRGAQGLRRAAVPGAARPALRDPDLGRAGGRGRLRGGRRGARAGRRRRLARRSTPAVTARVGLAVQGRWGRGTGAVQGIALATADAAPPTSRPSTSPARTTPRSRPGWPTRRCRRSPTT